MLWESWLKLWKEMGACGRPNKVFSEIIHRYTEPHRFYHSLGHIRRCLDEFVPARKIAHDPTAVEAALWGHDLVYDTHANDNEEKSAELFSEFLQSASLAQPFIDKVCNFILLTKHRCTPQEFDAQLVLDIDIAGLGKTFDEFMVDGIAIRLEYSWVSEIDFHARRKNILELFLNRPHIYHTDFFRRKYEKNARENLFRAIKELD